MGQQTRRESYSGPLPSTAHRKDYNYNYCHHHCHHHYPNQHFLEVVCKDETSDLVLPFDKLERLSQDDVRECAYEIFFTACRSSPGFGGGRNMHSFHWNNHENEKSGNVVMSPTSKVKRALGLKMLKRSPSRRMVSGGSGGPSSPVGGGSPFNQTLPPLRPRRPMTSAEIMRQQMRVTEHNDNRLRKTITRTLVGQAGRRAETIILPLELLRHLKPSEFSDSNEYHMWQKRQLRVLEEGLLTHPSIPLEKTSTFAMRLRDIIRNGESRPIDTGKNSDTLRTLSNSVVSLAWKSSNGTPTDVCHWADGFPLNIQLYTSLLQAIFDNRDDTLVLDEVDELLELMKKTWSILGITRPIHNVCFTWVLFQQYVVTGQIEPDLLCASQAMLTEVANDAKRERESFYVKLLTSVLSSIKGWTEKRLVDYHLYFQRGNIGQIENVLPVALLVSQILGDDLTISDDGEGGQKGDITIVDSSGDRVDYYIRSTIKNAFEKVIGAVNAKAAELEIKGELNEILLHLARETEDLAMKERENFTSMLKKWHPAPAAVAAMMLHSCYGHVLRQYIAEVTSLTHETVDVLQRAEKVEKVLLQMVIEDCGCEGDDNGKTVMREMIPYEVDSIILNLLRKWINESLCNGKECLQRAKETETWNPKSKSEPYAPSATELVKFTKIAVEQFFQIPIGMTEDIVQELADGLESLFQDYMMFVAACGTKQSYIPSLPPLTRCNHDSKFIKLWKKASPCGGNPSELDHIHEGHHPRPSTSRGTQRLYVRLNTLHYLLTHINTLEKILSHTPGVIPSSNRKHSSPYFEIVNSSIPAACQHVSEVAAYRLIFLDSNSVFYGSLYVGDVANARIRPALRILKQNITLMTTFVADRAQALAMKEVMKASFDAFLMVLLAGGSSRVFNRSDHVMIQEDFENLNRVFCTCGEGLIAENLVEREAAVVEGVIELMGQYTEQLMEDFSIATCETSGIGVMGSGHKFPMPPTTGRWSRSDPNTILRVLCHRNDKAANHFLKRTFQLAKRR